MYIHAINLNDIVPCLNIRIGGCLYTPDVVALFEPEGIGKNYTSVASLTDEALINGDFGESTITPRAGYVVLQGSMIRKGMIITDGYNKVKNYTDEDRAHIVYIADVEIAFERVRRECYPEHPSRLSCIYIAENSEMGRNLIVEMLGIKTVLTANIKHQLGLAKVNVTWFENYCANPDEKLIHNYWQGLNCNENNRWEYLLNGVLEFTKESIDLVKQHGNCG